jgi:hypothetical protein
VQRGGFSAVLGAAWVFAAPAQAAEVCRYAGTSDYNGRLSVVSTVEKSGGARIVDVAASVKATQFFWVELQYWMEERSVWRDGRLDDLAVNTRYFVGAHIVRQIWDRFERGADGFHAWRVQGKKPAGFLAKFPGFAREWDVDAFGQPWVDDFRKLPPERRPDLDLATGDTGPDLRTPFALAFYWDRYLPAGGATAPVFMPGFKTDKIMQIAIAPGADSGIWHAPLHYVALGETPPSSATATTADGHLERLTFELHGAAGSAQGALNELGCSGAPVPP